MTRGHMQIVGKDWERYEWWESYLIMFSMSEERSCRNLEGRGQYLLLTFAEKLGNYEEKDKIVSEWRPMEGKSLSKSWQQHNCCNSERNYNAEKESIVYWKSHFDNWTVFVFDNSHLCLISTIWLFSYTTKTYVKNMFADKEEIFISFFLL